MKFYTSAIVLLLFLFSCNRVPPIKTDINHQIRIPFPSVIDRVRFCKYSEVFDSVRMVKLETTKESMIGRIDKILVHEGNFFILDQVERKAVLEFSASGKFIRRFGSVGTGPGKYNMPNDMSIINNELAIWVSEASKFIIYDLNGTMSREVKTSSSAKSGSMLGKDAFALYLDIGADAGSREKFNLKILNKDGNVTYKGFEKKDKEFSKGSFFFNQNKNDILISPGYSNDIYSVHEDEIVKKYTIDFGAFKMPEDFPQKFPSLVKFDKGLNSSNYATLLNYFETPNYFTFSFTYHSLIYNCFYSKKTKVLKYGNVWFNNVHNVLPGIDKAVDHDNVIAYYDPSAIDYYKKNYTYPLAKDKVNGFIKEINNYFFAGRSNNTGNSLVLDDFQFTKDELDNLQTIKSSDNPILLIQKLKTF